MVEPFIWVSIPETGRQINVEPLLTALRSLDAPDDAINTGMLLVLKKTIRTLNVTVHDPQVTNPVSLANLYRDLHMLEDVFTGMIERVA